MQQLTNTYALVLMISLFYVLPFLLAIVLPSCVIPFLVKRILNKKKVKLPSLKPFIISLIFLASTANLFWERDLFNKVYYEWDRIFLPYTFFSHEAPLLDGNASWIAQGWKNWHLDIIWLFLTVIIYLTSAGFAYIRHRKDIQAKLYRKILMGSVFALTIASLLLSQLGLKGLGLLVNAPSNLNYKEVNVPCTKSPFSGPRILYAGSQAEWTSDLKGKNLKQAFKKHLQLMARENILSTNGASVSILWDNNIWIHCVNSDGAFKINLPKAINEAGINAPRSIPVWAPDSKQLIMNNNGDLLLINLIDKTTKVLKQKVALRDNHIDITSKNRDQMIPPFEYGDAYWNVNGTIYYTSFSDNLVSLHQFNPISNEDKPIRQSDKQLRISNGDPTGKWLFIDEYNWATKSKNEPQGKTYLFNTQSYELTEYNNESGYSFVWSPSGKYLAESTGSWASSPIEEAFPALLLDINTKQKINVSDIVKKYLDEKGFKVENKLLIVEIKDFVDESHLLIKILLQDSSTQIPRQINGIVDINSGKLDILQNYPENSYQNEKTDRLEPILIIK